jgi:hypothetical protein
MGLRLIILRVKWSHKFLRTYKIGIKTKHNLRKTLCKEVLNKWLIHQEMTWSYACQQFTLHLSPKLFHLSMTTWTSSTNLCNWQTKSIYWMFFPQFCQVGGLPNIQFHVSYNNVFIKFLNFLITPLFLALIKMCLILKKRSWGFFFFFFFFV